VDLSAVAANVFTFYTITRDLKLYKEFSYSQERHTLQCF